MCHSQIASNIITDFGFGGDGKGTKLFLRRRRCDPSERPLKHGRWIGLRRLRFEPRWKYQLGRRRYHRSKRDRAEGTDRWAERRQANTCCLFNTRAGPVAKRQYKKV